MRPLTGKVDNVDYLFICEWAGHIREQVKILSSELMFEAGKIGECEDLSEFDSMVSCGVFSVCSGQCLLQFFSIGLAHFLKQKLHSQNNMDKPPNLLANVHNRMAFLIHFIKWQMP